ncbi:MAG: type Z 30S ribosomal protein S14 [Rubrobacteraceae bacterium]|uniref:type Z 30S ribosomal protein S14 n=1 Tax=Rubrobacter naiadicus TaxID=1392641 RepID=UPI00235E3532|nr:type Z 30S ribosomal protein S14 [Rubrobacter naiadicus]MBX6763966.1 type Z 30S ribosomal protein S14 [Rubrobacteraceae bacterium]MCL6439380.1 type Z 30S ribosomal protein S14 [Rubrobacteraceae bacterium]
MTRKALLVKQRKPQKYSTREYNRCQRCGRSRAYYRKFGLCRICLRQLAHEGKIPGVKKASW